MSRKDCYWFTQGRCRLETLQDEYIRYALRQSPQARADLLSDCAGCADPDPKWVALAENPPTAHDASAHTEHFQRVNRRHRDHHRRLSPSPQTPVVPPKSGDEDE